MNIALTGGRQMSPGRRHSLALLAGSALAPAVAQGATAAGSARFVQLAGALGLLGLGARELIQRVTAEVGPQRMRAARSELLRRLGSSAAPDEMADLVRMWAREDFVQGRTTDIGGLRFADTEIAAFALVGMG